MNKSKNYNSIVFLTTLSVYLGLVLVGGTAPILAQAALTRDFDIKNEIVFEDDLDKKPDGEEINNSEEDFPQLFAQLIEQIKEEIAKGKISYPFQTNFLIELESESSQKEGGDISVSSNLSSANLNNIIQSAFNGKFQLKALELADYKGKFKKVKIRIEGNEEGFVLKISFSKLNAELFAEFLNNKFSNSIISANASLLKQIYENTKATSENNQVFIVTRLPRASIDALLAEKDAQ